MDPMEPRTADDAAPFSEASTTSIPPAYSSSSAVQAYFALLAATIQQLQSEHPFLVRCFLALRILAAVALVLSSICLAWFLAWKTVLRHVGFIRDIVHGVLGVKKPQKKRQTYVRKSGGGLSGAQASGVVGGGSEKGLGSSKSEARTAGQSEGKQDAERLIGRTEKVPSLSGDGMHWRGTV